MNERLRPGRGSAALKRMKLSEEDIAILASYLADPGNCTPEAKKILMRPDMAEYRIEIQQMAQRRLGGTRGKSEVMHTRGLGGFTSSTSPIKVPESTPLRNVPLSKVPETGKVNADPPIVKAPTEKYTYKTINNPKMKNETPFLELVNAAMKDPAFDRCHNSLAKLGYETFEKSERVHLLPTHRSFFLPIVRGVLPGAGYAGTATFEEAFSTALDNYMTLIQAGSKLYEITSPNLTLPVPSVASVFSKAENAESEDSGLSLGSILFEPKKEATFVDISKQLIAQGGPVIQQYIINLMFAAIASKVEGNILGKTAGSASKQQGLFYKNTTGTDTKAAAVSPTRTNILALEAEIDAYNALRGKTAFITSGAGARLLKTTPREPGMDRFLFEDGKMLEHPLFFSNNVPNNCGSDAAGAGLVLANFEDLIIVQVAGYIITVDPFTLAKENKVRLHVTAFFDAKGARGSLSTGVGTDADDYATFARMAIK